MILGFWKVLGVVAPRFPILKEWAYAGMFFTMTGAAVSHVVVGDPAVMLVAPIIFTGFVIVSWALRSVAHRDTLADSAFSSRSRTVAYWVAAELLALECGVGGVLGALRLHHSPGLWRISVTRPI